MCVSKIIKEESSLRCMWNKLFENFKKLGLNTGKGGEVRSEMTEMSVDVGDWNDKRGSDGEIGGSLWTKIFVILIKELKCQTLFYYLRTCFIRSLLLTCNMWDGLSYVLDFHDTFSLFLLNCAFTFIFFWWGRENSKKTCKQNSCQAGLSVGLFRCSLCVVCSFKKCK